MKKILENVTRLTTKVEYELLSAHLENLIQEATKGGYLADPDENDYTREIARLSILGAQYADEFMSFSFSQPKSPLVLSIQRAMVERGMKQKEAARFLGIQEPTFSRFMCGKSKMSYDLAKRLYTKFHIKPELIFEA
ncbi:MAG: helix-turn-helix domain-containing protein [Bacteroidales bacterium]|jgi:antitoxin component HigA of HigAB toxin-antitoxin module|nr:helix-turn-helix domain-containing protein [Bacteroidales bacterium]